MIQFCYKCRGAVSVFLTLILIPVFVLQGVLIDGSRIIGAKNIISGSGDLAMNAALSNYSEELNRVYGLLAMAQTPEQVQEALQDFFQASLNASGVSEEDFAKSLIYLEMMDGSFKSVGVEGSQIYQTEVFKQQILEYMKYRAPVTFLDRAVLSRLEGLKEAKKEQEAAKAQLDYESSLEDLQDLFEKIKGKNDYNRELGIGGSGTEFLKRAYEEVYLEKIQDAILENSEISYKEIALLSVALSHLQNCSEKEEGEDTEALMRSMVDLEESCDISRLDVGGPSGALASEDQVNAKAGTAATLIQMKHFENALRGASLESLTAGINAEEEPDLYAEKVKLWEDYRAACRALKDNQDKLEKRINQVVFVVFDQAGGQYRLARRGEACCREVLEDVKNLEEKLKKVKEKYQIWKQKVNALKDGETKTGYQKNIEEADRLFGDPRGLQDTQENMAGFKSLVADSCDFYKKTKEKLKAVTFTGYPICEISDKDKFFGEADGYKDGIKTQGDLLGKRDAFMGRYNDPELSLGGAVNKDIANNAFVKDLEEIYCKKNAANEEEKNKGKDFAKNNVNEQMKKIADLWLSEDVAGKSVDKNGEIPSKWLSQTATADAQKPDLGEGGIDGKDERKNTTDKAQNLISQNTEQIDGISRLANDLLGEASKKGEAIAEPIYITEYVIGMFSCYTSKTEIPEPLSLSRDKLKERPLYQAEVEYILWGDSDAVSNVGKTKALIFAINLAFNMGFAFTNSDIREGARLISLAFPVGPLLQIVIRCALQSVTAMVETVKNMTLLMEGRRVALVKGKEDWSTWLFVPPAGGGTKSQEGNPEKGISYEEYLWVFVCANMYIPSNQTALLARTADCIELNMKKGSGESFLKDKYTMLQVEAKVKVDTFFLPRLKGLGYVKNEVNNETFAIPYLGLQGY